ncbi:MAG: HAMP domain-containing sensor histidine kinase [Aerococcaceae bacterium]|nr:HAMP domain-containing sensor histidine kinase [Aerococcaceae bacterium]
MWIGWLIAFVLGFLCKKWLISKELHFLTQQLQAMRKQKLHRQLTVRSSHAEFTPLLEELGLTIEEQRSNVAQLQQQESQLKADLMNISHDLRTPLTAIYGYLELLNDTDLSASERTHYLEIATERTQILQAMIQDLFYLGKLEANAIEHEVELVALDHLLKEQIVGLYQAFQEANFELDVAIEEQTFVKTDSAAATRIINNVLTNSLQHGQSPLTITHRFVNGRYETQFKNTLSPQHTVNIEQVFQRHYTSHTHRNQNNSGLGLTICYELCQQLGHTIEAHLEGNQFILTITW